MELVCGESCMILTLTVFDSSTDPPMWRSDGQTDEWTGDSIVRYSIYAVASDGQKLTKKLATNSLTNFFSYTNSLTIKNSLVKLLV